MILLAGVMAAYVRQVKAEAPDVKHGVFVDDRLMWAVGQPGALQFQNALRATKEFDDRCKFKWNVGKGVLFHANGPSNRVSRAWKRCVGKVSTKFDNLGLEYTTKRDGLRDAKRRVKPKVFAKCKRQLERIRLACRNGKIRRKCVHSLIMPKLRYGAAWRKTSGSDKLTIAVERCIRGKVWAGRSRALMWMLDLGAEAHPQFTEDWAVICAIARRLRKASQRQTSVNVDEGRLQEVCTKWSWKKESVQKLKTPEGVIDITRDSKACIMSHARKGWERWLLSQDKRGGNETTDWREYAHYIGAHKKWWEYKVPIQRAVAVGACNDHRMLWRVEGCHRNACACGEPEPTRRHWLWHCGTWPYRDIEKDEDRPRCEMEEGLALPMVRRARPHAELDCTAPQGLVRSLRGAQDGCLVATDGSSLEKRAAGWGIAVAQPNRTVGYSIHGVVSGADQSSWAAELEAVTKLLRAAKEAERRGMVVMIDNLCVCRGVAALAAKDFKMPKWGFGRWAVVKQLIEDLGHSIQAHWLPSHDKQPDWSPPDASLGSAEEWRRLNQVADEKAGEGAANQEVRYGYAAFDDAVTRADEWARYAFDRLHSAAKAYIEGDDILREKLTFTLEEPRR